MRNIHLKNESGASLQCVRALLEISLDTQSVKLLESKNFNPKLCFL